MTFDPESTIERCPHDAEHPYTMVSNSLIRDKEISPACRWLVIYLLSSIDRWKIKVAFVAAHVGEFMCKEIVYKLFDEAMEAGYLKRDEYVDAGLKRYRYILSETKKFKKCLPCTGLPDTVKPDTLRITNLKNNQEEEERSSSSSSLRSSSSDPEKEQMRGMMKTLISATEEEFEEAWRKYQFLDPNKIPHPKAWFAKVIENARPKSEVQQSLGLHLLKQQCAVRNKKIAEDKERKFPKSKNPELCIICLEDEVLMISGAHQKRVRYDVNIFEWEEKTGWEE